LLRIGQHSAFPEPRLVKRLAGAGTAAESENLEPGSPHRRAQAAGRHPALIFRQILSATPEPCALARKGALWQEPAARGCRIGRFS